MEECESVQPEQGEFDLGGFLSILRPALWKISVFSLCVGIVMQVWMLRKPDLYRASASITPAVEESKQNPAFGALASIGISVGGPSRVENLETMRSGYSKNTTLGRLSNRKVSIRKRAGSSRVGWTDCSARGQQKEESPLIGIPSAHPGQELPSRLKGGVERFRCLLNRHPRKGPH